MNFACWAAGTWAAGTWAEGSWCPGEAPGGGNIVMRLVHETPFRRRIIAGVPVYDEEEEALVLALMETLLNE